MVNKTLVNYIQEQVRNGYDTRTIRIYLIKYGYSQDEVDEAMRSMYSSEVRHIIHLSPTTMVAVVTLFLGIIVASFVFYNLIGSKTPDMLLDLSLDSVKTTAKAGEGIVFISEIDNLGSAIRYDVNIKYEIISLETNDVITFKEETRAIETKGSKQINMEVPSDAAVGDYVLRAIAKYNGQRAVATLPVNVEEGVIEPVEEPIKPTEEPTEPVEEPTEEPIEPVEEPTEEPIEPVEEPTDKVSTALSTFETLERVEKIAKDNRREAEKLCKDLELQTSRDLCFNKLGEVLGDRTYCSKIEDERTKDVCLSNVANIIDKSEICEEISKDSRKDNCYMIFVLPPKKDYTVCDKVINEYLKQSCESLKQLSKLNITDVAFYESLISQSLIELI